MERAVVVAQCNELAGEYDLSNVVTVGEYSFFKCNALEGITLSDKCESIGSDAFTECTSLSVTAPAGSYAAAECEKLGIEVK